MLVVCFLSPHTAVLLSPSLLRFSLSSPLATHLVQGTVPDLELLGLMPYNVNGGMRSLPLQDAAATPKAIFSGNLAVVSQPLSQVQAPPLTNIIYFILFCLQHLLLHLIPPIDLGDRPKGSCNPLERRRLSDLTASSWPCKAQGMGWN